MTQCGTTRRGRSSAVAALLLAVVVGVLTAPTVGACSPALASYVIEGPAAGRNASVVTFRVESAERPEPVDPEHLVPLPTTGSLVTVEYGDDARYVDPGARYRVVVYGAGDGGVPSSSVDTAEDTCGGAGTTFADGSAIETGLFTRNGFEPWVGFAVGIPVLLVVAGTTTVLFAVRSRRRDRSRAEEVADRLSDGQTRVDLPGVGRPPTSRR